MKTQQSAVNRNSSRGWTRSPLLLTAAAMGALVLSGCGAAQLVNVWRDPDFQGKKIRSVLVVSQRPDPAARRLWEDAVSAQMNKQGVEAVPSYQIFPDSPPPKSRMTRALEDRGLDGGLIMKPLRATAETRWVPGWTSVEPRSYYDPWANAHVIVYRHRWHPGYAVSDRYAREEVTLWSAEDDGRMVWAGTVEVENPSSPDDLRKDLAKGVVPEMKKAGLI